MSAKSKDQAMAWFLANSSGTLLCVGKDGKTSEVGSFPEAVRFFNEHGSD